MVDDNNVSLERDLEQIGQMSEKRRNREKQEITVALTPMTSSVRPEPVHRFSPRRESKETFREDSYSLERRTTGHANRPEIRKTEESDYRQGPLTT